MKKPRCVNCKFAGEQFKIDSLTQVHCENKQLYPESERDINTPWETLREWWDRCDKHEPAVASKSNE